jgi:glutamate-ammonia-ligase adenylyltransferase
MAAELPALLENSPHHSVLARIAAGSPYLLHLMQDHPRLTGEVLSGDPVSLLDASLGRLRRDFMLHDQPALMRSLRQTKAEAALIIALADLSGRWTIEQATEALTATADAFLEVAVDWQLAEGARSGKGVLADAFQPSRGSGYTVLAMGKHGAGELNYSSDIDLIVLYDAEQNFLNADVEPGQFFVRLTKRLVGLLQEVTGDGYAFRVDLRLRPDPRATQVAISLEAAAIYYESMGQNWERAAMIKARAVAGDVALGEEFLARLKPYVWRKYLDFAAIADVQSLKLQIHAVKGHGAIAVHGHNLKLGRGGIREIEFFVQTQQLIAGGRNPALRGRRTLEMLDSLAAANWITTKAAAELQDAYRFLRTIEHRVQMVNDEQTHVLPATADGFDRLARFCGHEPAAFEMMLRTTFETVQGHYAALFEEAKQLGTEGGSLVFTGGEDDPETIETLSRLGFRRPSELSATIRGWHFGRYAATRSSRSKELLTELMPNILTALASTGEPDEAFVAFDRFIGGLPAGVQLFSLLKARPGLLELLATVLGTAPRLAEQLSRRPQVLDAVLDPGFFDALPQPEEIRGGIAAMMPEGTTLDDVADRARVFGKEQGFRIGVRILSETVSAEEAGRAHSDLAELLLERLHRAVSDDMRAKHGEVPGGRSAVIAMGKLGGHEMTAGSDLDLILVYDCATGTEYSDGARPLAVPAYYSRLTQRLIAAVSAQTAEGVLYDVDMRLRPSGSKGPVAASLDSFKLYHRESSWTWEKLALTRARVICGDPSLVDELTAAIRAVLGEKRDALQTIVDVLNMRRLMLKEHGEAAVWDIKRVRGGLVELEFIAQSLQLIYGPANPGLFDTNTIQCLTKLRDAGVLPAGQGQDLLAAAALYHRLTQVLRLCLNEGYDPRTATAGLNRIVTSTAACPDVATVEALLGETQAVVSVAFDGIIGKPS